MLYLKQAKDLGSSYLVRCKMPTRQQLKGGRGEDCKIQIFQKL